MSRRCRARVGVAARILPVAAAVALSAGAARAQDIEAEAAIRGIQLPQGYYDRIRKDPTAFQFDRVWPSSRPAAVGGTGASFVTEGAFPLVVVPILFADSEEPLFDREALQRVLFDGPAEHGTMVEFYEAASRGRFTVEGTVLPWTRASLPVAAVVAESFGLGEDARTGDYLAEGLALADPDVDFGRFDNDGPDGIPNSGDDDGVVDAVTFEFQEVTASCGGPGIWPHRWRMSGWLGDPYTTDDPGAGGGSIQIEQYIIQGATDCDGTAIQSAGVISHEFGHALGLPDIYHPIDGIEPQFRRWVLGCWGLMAAGSWGCGDGSTRGDIFGPTNFSPWSKHVLGWIDWVDVGSVFNETIELQSATESGQALRIPLDESGTEFLVVEYRPRTGFDEALPSQGVLVYHWDLAGVRRPERDSGTPYLFSMEEADGRTDLRLTHGNGGNRGEASDAWGVNGPQGPLNANSVPNTRRNAGDQPSTVVIHSIQADGPVARIRLTTTPQPGVLDPGALPPASLFNPYSGTLEIAGGSPPYSALFVGENHGLTLSADDRFLSVTGAPDVGGTLDLDVTLNDGRGRSGLVSFVLQVGDFVMTTARAVTAFVENGETPLNADEARVLDERGNGNGRYDIGDLRALLYDASAPEGSGR